MEQAPMDRLREIMARLRAPGGCPWDQEQTHKSIKPSLLEESHEVIEAIDANDMTLLKEELGDVLLQVVFHSQMAAERGDFTLDDVATGIADKLVRRHPHVFGTVEAKDSDTVIKNWNAIKQQEKPERKGIFDGIPKALPALMASQEMQKKVARVNFDWPERRAVLAKVREELDELEDALDDPNHAKEELGDLLFVLANLARHLKLDAEQSLMEANSKFRRRFERVQEIIISSGKTVESAGLEALEVAWQQTKREERTAT